MNDVSRMEVSQSETGLEEVAPDLGLRESLLGLRLLEKELLEVSVCAVLHHYGYLLPREERVYVLNNVRALELAEHADLLHGLEGVSLRHLISEQLLNHEKPLLLSPSLLDLEHLAK